MEQTRTVWHMQLDHQRNRVLRINLLISIMSLGANRNRPEACCCLLVQLRMRELRKGGYA